MAGVQHTKGASGGNERGEYNKMERMTQNMVGS
jgi:hypothetical protein